MKKIVGIILALALVISIGGYVMIAGAEGETPENVAAYINEHGANIEDEIKEVFTEKGLEGAVCKVEQITKPGEDEKPVPTTEVAIYIALPVSKVDDADKVKRINDEVLTDGKKEALKGDFKFFADEAKGCKDITKVSLYFCTNEAYVNGEIDSTKAIEYKIGEPITVYEKTEVTPTEVPTTENGGEELG